MKKYIIANDTEINESNVGDWIKLFLQTVEPKMRELDNYYEGRDELGKLRVDNKRADNIIHVNLAHMIVSDVVSYCFGKPMTYDFVENYENEEYIRDLQYENGENLENIALAKDCSKYGLGYEYIGVNQNKEVFYKRLDPLFTFKVIDDSILANDVCVVTYSIIRPKNKAAYKHGFIYTAQNIIEFDYRGGRAIFTNVQDNIAFPNVLPVVCYKNNDETIGDYEMVLEPLSAYSKLYSCSFDDIDAISNALLIFYNGELDEEEKEKLERTRVVGMTGENARAEYIYKKLDINSFKALREALRVEILTIASIPDLADICDYNKSGTAVRFKMISLEDKRMIKNIYMEKALRTRLDIISKFVGKPFDINRKDVELQFYSNLPTNLELDSQLMDLVEKGGISLYSALKQMESVSDTDEEYKRIRQEQRERVLSALDDIKTESGYYEDKGLTE
jgi:SPP1 family phage portal protein